MCRLLVVISIAAAASLTAFAAPRYSAELIFPEQDKHVHGSSIVVCSNGDLLACWFQGSGERSADDVRIMGARMKKGETSWSEPFLMADTPDFPDCNPVLFIDPQGRLWLFWITVQGHRWELSLLKYRRATEYQGNGAPKWDWQDVILLRQSDAFADTLKRGLEELMPEEGMWSEYALPYPRMLKEAAKDQFKRETGWMTRTVPVVLPSGRILLPLYSDGFNTSMMAITDDGGESWRASGPIVGLGPIQPTVVAKRDGTLVAYMRDSGALPMRALMSTSNDNGDTWSFARDTDIVNPGSSLAVCGLKDGRWVMVYNDSEADRRSLAAMMSDDEGKTWKWSRHLDRTESGKGSYAYPCVIQSTDGTVHVTYSYDSEAGASIKHTAFEPAWIAEAVAK
ncbi:MAG: exo-alpha-sialidase [Candidatus Hydrogenedentes bacterium]|nr:exo-alpha-sialidase [Candidatus Hydrogenedentota bacterium]